MFEMYKDVELKIQVSNLLILEPALYAILVSYR